MLASRLRRAWENRNIAGAKRSLRIPDSALVDFSVLQKYLADSSVSNRSRSLVTSYVCQTVRSHDRLHHVGYDVVQGCPLCHAHRDDLHHRLFECSGTLELRRTILEEGDADRLRERSHLLFGVTVVPRVPQDRPHGYGHEQYVGFTSDGRNIKEWFAGAVVYSDGSCLKTGHPIHA